MRRIRLPAHPRPPSTGEGERKVKVFQQETQLRTSRGLSGPRHHRGVIDVAAKRVVHGIACVYSPHTTCCVRVNESRVASWTTRQHAQALIRATLISPRRLGTRRTENICPGTWTSQRAFARMAMCWHRRESDPGARRRALLGRGSGCSFLELDASATPLDRPGRRHVKARASDRPTTCYAESTSSSSPGAV